MPKQKPFPGSYPRLLHPMVRAENGALRQATWDEALDVARGRFRRESRDAWCELARNLQLLEGDERGNFLAAEAARVAFGNNNIDSCNRT